MILETNGFELNNVNKGGRITSKHTEFWAKKLFDDWQQFQGYDIQKFIINLFKSEKTTKDLIDMLCLFVLQVAKTRTTLFTI